MSAAPPSSQSPVMELASSVTEAGSEPPFVARFMDSPWVMSNIPTHPYYNRVAATIKWDRDHEAGDPTCLDMELGIWLCDDGVDGDGNARYCAPGDVEAALERETGYDIAHTNCPPDLCMKMQVLLQVWIWEEVAKHHKCTFQTSLNGREDYFNSLAAGKGKPGPAPWKNTPTMRKRKRPREGSPSEGSSSEELHQAYNKLVDDYNALRRKIYSTLAESAPMAKRQYVAT